MTVAAIVILTAIAVLPIVPAAVRERLRQHRAGSGNPGPVIDIITVAIFLPLAACAAALAAAGGAAHGVGAVVAICAAALAATTGGGFVVRLVLAAGGVTSPAPETDRDDNDDSRDTPPRDTVVGPLRGGRVIGYLERAAVTTALLAGWPEGLAVILAVKSLARYPELRAPHASEQFIMGTFASVLWAAGMSGIGYLILH